MLGMPATRVRGFSDGLSSRNTPAPVNSVTGNVRAVGRAHVAGDDVEKRYQVAVLHHVFPVTDAEVVPDARTLGGREAPRDRADILLLEVTELGGIGRRDQVGDELGLLPAVRMLGDEGVVDEPFLDDHVEHRQQEVQVCTRADLEVHVGLLRRLVPSGVDDDERPLRIVGDLSDHDARALE